MHRLATNGREFLFSNIYTNSLHTNNFRSRQILFYRLKSDSSSSTTTENLQSVQPNNESPLTKKILNQQSQQNPNQSRKPQQHNTNYQHGTPLKNSQPQPNKQPSFLEKLSLNYIQQKPQRQSTNQNNEQKPSQNQQQNQPKNFNNQQQNKNKSNQNQRNNMNQQNSQNQKNNQNQQNQPRNFNQQNNQFNNSQNQKNSTNQVQQNQQNQSNQQSQQNQSNQQNQSQKKVGYSSEFMEKLIKSAPNYKSGQNTQYQQNKPNEQNYQNQKNHQKQKSFQQKPREFQKGNNRNGKNNRDNNGRNTRFQDNGYEEYTPIEIEPRPRFPQQPKIKDVTLPVPVTVKGLAQILGTRVVDILKTMITMGEKPSSHIEPLPRDLAEVICQEYGFTVLKTSNKLDIHRTPLPEDKSKLSPRPPVVVVMGHINHGKTSILDALRKTQMADREAGKITQAISSFQHTTSSGAKITFMDTPGHEAFSKMRERGSQITDLAILVVAADEGVKEQTIEAIEHIKSAKLLPIVAINKVDKEGADVNKVKQQLAQHEIYTEDHGGDIVAVPISARSGTGLTDLEEAILFQSEVLELRADPTQRGEATVVESFMHKGFGPVANTIIRNGTIKTGDYFVVGKTYGRVRFLFDADGKNMKSAGPSAAVQIVGLRNLAEPADDVIILDNEDFARQVAEYRIREGELEVAKQGRFDLIKAVKAGEKSFLPFNDQPVEDEIEEEVEEEEESDINEQKEFNVFIKGDSGGSIEAVIQAINELPHDPEISVKVLKTSIGVVTQSDLFLADTAKGIFLSFNVSNTQKIILAAQQQGTPIIESKIIYEIVEKLKTKLESTLSPITSISTIGSAEVKMIFPINKKKNVFQNVAGCLVKQGSIKRSSTIEVHRNGSKIWEGKISSLKHIKNDINEAKNNTECGIALDGFDDLKEGDIFQAIDVTKTPRKLGESLVPNKR